MRSTHDYEIGGKQYRTTALPATKALTLLPRLITLLGPELLKLILADDDAIGRAVEDPDMRVGLIGLIAEHSQAGELVILKDLLADTAVRAEDGTWQPLDFDEYFSADLRLLFDVAVQATIGSFTRPLLAGSPSQSSLDIRASRVGRDEGSSQ